MLQFKRHSAIFLIAGCPLFASANNSDTAIKLANLHEDMTTMTQVLKKMKLEVELLQNENANLRSNVQNLKEQVNTLNHDNRELKYILSVWEKKFESNQRQLVDAINQKIGLIATQTNQSIKELQKVNVAKSSEKSTFSADYPKEGVEYTVQAGDTLSSIAMKMNSKTDFIQNANKIANPRDLQAGKTIFVPQKH